MPAWNRIKKSGICKAIRIWQDLESLTMPSIANPPYLLEEMGRSCKKLAELKIMGPFDIYFASAIVAFLPNLKVLSLRCSMVNKDALIIILEGLKQLEVLNISHAVIFVSPGPPAPKKLLKELDISILEKAEGLRQFLRCMDDSCIMCQRTRSDEGYIRWYKYEEGSWKFDEVPSLAI